jgi:NAD(P)-dependent dehydrogenase (short-subunit alcohol dehydrogenase family)
MTRLDGRVALVTGAARGFGAAIAARLAEAGAAVVMTDLLEAAGQVAAERIADAGGTALFRRHDVSSESDWNAVIATVMKRFGGLDVLVNNAGMVLMKRTEETTLEDWRRLSAVNLDGVFLGTRSAIGAMKARAQASPAGGSIINISSTAGITGAGIAPAYSMTKGGVRLFSKATALEFAKLGYRVRVNSVHPGLAETEMGEEVVSGVVRFGMNEDRDSARVALTARAPLGRLATPADIAAVVLFLASDDSAYMTGTEVIVDGGFTAQ